MTQDQEANVTDDELYQFHPGSLKISGKTKSHSAGRYAANLWRSGKRPVDFVYLGGNAGQQADKAAHAMMMELAKLFNIIVGFVPMRVMVKTEPDENGKTHIKDAFVWRAIPLKEGVDDG